MKCKTVCMVIIDNMYTQTNTRTHARIHSMPSHLTLVTSPWMSQSEKHKLCLPISATWWEIGQWLLLNVICRLQIMPPVLTLKVTIKVMPFGCLALLVMGKRC